MLTSQINHWRVPYISSLTVFLPFHNLSFTLSSIDLAPTRLSRTQSTCQSSTVRDAGNIPRPLVSSFSKIQRVLPSPTSYIDCKQYRTLSNRPSKFTMTSQASSVGCTTFTLFPRLPMEIRELIWHMTLPGPRLVEIQYKHSSSSEGNTLLSGAFPRRPPPVSLRVCQESRNKALRVYTLCIPTKIGVPKCYFSPPLDTLLLPCGWLHRPDPCMLTQDVLGKIENICFSYPELDLAHTVLKIWHLYERFPGLKTISAALDHRTDENRVGEPSLEVPDPDNKALEVCQVKIEEAREAYLGRFPQRKLPFINIMILR